MGLAQGSCAQKEFQIYVICAADLCYLHYSQETMTFVRRFFDLIFHENDGGCEKSDT